MFGGPRLHGVAAAHRDNLLDGLLTELAAFTGEGWDQEDDITLLPVSRAGP